MSVSISFVLDGLRVAHTHGPSGAKLNTSPPKDNGGDGSAFSPTDLLAASFASCALTTMSLLAHRNNLPFSQAKATILKDMGGPPRKVSMLTLEIEMPTGLSAEHKKLLEDAAHTCPVARSLHPDVQVKVSFTYPK